MHQLTTSDAMFLYMENATNYGHVGGIQILDSPTVPKVREGDELDDHTEAFLQMIPYTRRKLAEMPFKLGHPFWVDDADFDLEYHLRQTAVAPPGRPDQVADLCCRLATQPLDRSRPLWEMYEIEGIDGGTKSANFSKVHHCAADGSAMMAAAMATLTMSPDIVSHPRPDTKWEPERLPEQMELMLRGLGDVAARPGKAVSWARRMMREAITMFSGESELRTHLPDVMQQARSMSAPKTRFSTMIGPHRRFAYGSTSLEEIKAIRKAFGCTVNDVVLAITAGMLRTWLDERGELPEESLMAMVPINIRENDALGDAGNSISATGARLFTDVADPVDRLGQISASMKTNKVLQKAVPADVQLDALNLMAPWAMQQAMRLAYRTRQTPRLAPFNLTISNVPGPPFPVYVDGAQQLASYPFSTITDGVGLNVTVTSYNGNLDWGIVADRDQCDELWSMMDGIRDAQAELLKLAG